MKLKHIMCFWHQLTGFRQLNDINTYTEEKSKHRLYLFMWGWGGGGLWRQGPPSCSRRKQIDLLTL